MAIIASHKAQITYLERTRIVKADEKVSYLRESEGVERTFALPYGNMAVLLLGPGTSITQSAMHHLTEQGCLIGFTGGGGYPIFCGSLSEYRPTEYAQAWLLKWQTNAWQLAVAKHFQSTRVALVNKYWEKHDLSPECVEAAAKAGKAFISAMLPITEKTHLLGAEATYAKHLYHLLAQEFGVKFTREPQTKADSINELIDTHNYYAYGLAGVSLWVLGIPHSMPVLHGVTRRGALVFDVADIIKDGVLLPVAFKSARSGLDKSAHRKECSKHLEKSRALDILFTELKTALELELN